MEAIENNMKAIGHMGPITSTGPIASLGCAYWASGALGAAPTGPIGPSWDQFLASPKSKRQWKNNDLGTSDIKYHIKDHGFI